MAINQVDKRRNMASKLIAQSTALMDALNALSALANEYSSSGLTFVDSDFENTSMQHVDAAAMTAVITNANNLKTYLEAQFMDDVFLKVRQ